MSKVARSASGALMAVVLTAGMAQAAPLPGFVLAAQTQHFTFYNRNHEKVDAEKTERYLAQVEQLLGQKVSGHAEYYRYGTAQELAAGTGTYAAGVTFAA